jgi:hypothetical protein
MTDNAFTSRLELGQFKAFPISIKYPGHWQLAVLLAYLGNEFKFDQVYPKAAHRLRADSM